MGLESIATARLIIVAVIALGFVPIAVAHWRHNMRWTFSAYVALVIGAALVLAGSVLNLAFTPVFAPAAIAASGILFFVATHQSEKKITELENDIRETTVSIGGDDR